jgi:hypothetical protein
MINNNKLGVAAPLLETTFELPLTAVRAASARQRAPESSGFEEDVERLADFNRTKLREWNERIQREPSSLTGFETETLALVDWPQLRQVLARPTIDRDLARELMKQLGFVLASLNRHLLVRGAHVGSQAESAFAEMFRQGRGVDIAEFLGRLASHAKHPPYKSYWSYWMGNPEGLAFTNDPGEQYFRFAVNETNRRFALASELLRPIQTGDVGFSDASAVALIDCAVREIEPLRNIYNFRLENVETGQPRLTADFFMKIMRGYLAPVLLEETKIEGPNATYSPGWPRVDFAVGNRSLFYVNTVQSRYRWMLPEHRIVLDQALDMPSVADRLVGTLELEPSAPHGMEAAQLRDAIVGRSPALASAALRYAAFVLLFNMISSTHISMIRNFLTKPAQQLSEAELARIVPRPDTGVGGNPLKETDAILRMRRTHPFNSKLIDALRATI